MRTSGVLMPISSLPSPYGIGTMGKSARKFVDFLVKGGQTCWQILPICPASYGDSPYQSFSSFAGNPYFIDLDILCKENLLKEKECESFDWGTSEEYIDYGTMYVSRYALLHKAYARFVKNMPEEMTEEALAKHEIIQIRLKEEIPERYVCMVYDRKRPMSVAAQKLKQILDKGESYAEIK